MKDRERQLAETCDGLRAENIELASNVEQVATLLSSLSERCGHVEEDLRNTSAMVQVTSHYQ